MSASKHKELCSHCGASMMSNAYAMNKALIGALTKMLNNPGVEARSLNLTKSEYTCYTKLKYWGFIEQVEDGLWHVTEQGRNWALGRISCPREIRYFRDRVIERIGRVNVWSVIKGEESKQKYREFLRTIY